MEDQKNNQRVQEELRSGEYKVQQEGPGLNLKLRTRAAPVTRSVIAVRRCINVLVVVLPLLILTEPNRHSHSEERREGKGWEGRGGEGGVGGQVMNQF